MRLQASVEQLERQVAALSTKLMHAQHPPTAPSWLSHAIAPEKIQVPLGGLGAPKVQNLKYIQAFNSGQLMG